MKRKIVFLFFASLLLLNINSFGQTTLKFGHINTQELLPTMPEFDSAQTKIQLVTKQLQDQLEQMQVEYNKKLEAYVTKRDSLTELIKQTKEAELQEMQQRIQQFKENAQQDLQKQQGNLFKPIYDKANKAIEAVGKENKFTYIFDVSTGVVLFKSADSQDVLPLVKKKLGITK